MHSSHGLPMVKIYWIEGKDKTEKQSCTANKKYCFNDDSF